MNDIEKLINSTKFDEPHVPGTVDTERTEPRSLPVIIDILMEKIDNKQLPYKGNSPRVWEGDA